VLNLFRETDRKFQETERLLKEQAQETDRKFQETDRKPGRVGAAHLHRPSDAPAMAGHARPVC